MFVIIENSKNEIIMINDYTIYKQKVWEFLDNMAPGDAYLIENLAKSENRNQFILCVKIYMDTKKLFQGYITFNSNYTKIYKTDEITFKKDITVE
jgi:hypothetical protein